MITRSLVSAVGFLFVTNLSFGRDWVSNDGKKLEADFIALENSVVKLKRPNGQVISVPLERLSEEDRIWAENEASKPIAEVPVEPIEGPFADLVTGEWELSEAEDVKFAFYGATTMSGDRKYPLVLALHGKSGNAENGKQVSGWMKSFSNPGNASERPCYILAPMSAQPLSGEGMGWREDEAGRIVKVIKAMIKDLNIDAAKIYIVGHSMGGAGTCNVMAEEPRMFAAAIPVAGVSIAAIEDISRKPMWMFHAEDDKLVPVAGARDFAEQMKRNKNFKYTESATGGHGVVGSVFNDPETHKWLFSQSL